MVATGEVPQFLSRGTVGGFVYMSTDGEDGDSEVAMMAEDRLPGALGTRPRVGLSQHGLELGQSWENFAFHSVYQGWP